MTKIYCDRCGEVTKTDASNRVCGEDKRLGPVVVECSIYLANNLGYRNGRPDLCSKCFNELADMANQK